MGAHALDQPGLGFIVGGVQKSGTTGLFGYLRQHRQLATPSVKEMHFFDDETQNWTEPDYRKLGSFFPKMLAKGISKKISGDGLDSTLCDTKAAGLGIGTLN